jgi:hypothetical protein
MTPHRLVTFLAIMGNILKSRYVRHLNEYDILVSTPSSMRSLLEAKKLRLDCIKYLIVDELTRVNETTGLHQLTDDLCAIVSHLPVSTKEHPVKIVLFSRHWNQSVQNLVEQVAGVFKVFPPVSAHSPGLASSSSSHSAQGGLPNIPFVPSMQCESYLKIMVSPKAFPHTMFPRTALVPFCKHLFRTLQYIPHHFVPCHYGTVSRQNRLLEVLHGSCMEENCPTFGKLSPMMMQNLTNETEEGRQRSYSWSNSQTTRHGSGNHIPHGFLVLTNTADEAKSLHEFLSQQFTGNVLHLVLPDTLCTVLSAVRSEVYGTSMSAAASPAKATGISDCMDATGGESSPLLVLVSNRPDASTGDWMLDLKAICTDVAFTIVNYSCPTSVDDYHLSLLSYVSPHVAHAVDNTIKMTLNPQKMPFRHAPAAVVTIYSKSVDNELIPNQSVTNTSPPPEAVYIESFRNAVLTILNAQHLS